SQRTLRGVGAGVTDLAGDLIPRLALQHLVVVRGAGGRVLVAEVEERDAAVRAVVLLHQRRLLLAGLLQRGVEVAGLLVGVGLQRLEREVLTREAGPVEAE